MYLSLSWKIQYEKMHNNMKEAIAKINNTTIIAPLVHIYFNTYLLKAVYFSCEIIELNKYKKII